MILFEEKNFLEKFKNLFHDVFNIIYNLSMTYIFHGLRFRQTA